MAVHEMFISVKWVLRFEGVGCKEVGSSCDLFELPLFTGERAEWLPMRAHVENSFSTTPFRLRSLHVADIACERLIPAPCISVIALHLTLNLPGKEVPSA